MIATVLVMASIFVPAAFLPGTTGQLYKQFAITIAISVAISGFVALTLTPALCGVLLRHTTPPAAGLLRLVQPEVRRASPRPSAALVVLVIRRMAIAFVFLAAVRGPHRHLLQGAADELRAERGPGLRDGGRHHAGRGQPRPDRGGHRPGRRDLRRDAGRRRPHAAHRLQPPRRRPEDERRHPLRHAEAVRRALRLDGEGPRRERARRAAERLREGPGDPRGARHPGGPAGDPRHRHDRRLRVLGPGHRRRATPRGSTS